MSSDSPAPTAADRHDATISVGAAQLSPCGPPFPGASPALALRPLEGLILGVVAGVIVWAVVQAVHPIFRVPKEFDVASIGRPTEEFLAHRRELDRRDRWHAALYLGGLGFLLMAAIALREAVAHRAAAGGQSAPRAIKTWLLLIAPVLAAAGAAIGGLIGCQILQDVRTNVGAVELKHNIIGQLAVALLLGLAVGLGLAPQARSLLAAMKILITGLAAGALAAVAYPVLLSIAMPAVSAETLMPEEAVARLLWFTLLPATIGVLLPLSGRDRSRADENRGLAPRG